MIIVGDDQDVVYDWNVFAKKCYDFCNDPRSCKPYLVAAVQFIEWFTVELIGTIQNIQRSNHA